MNQHPFSPAQLLILRALQRPSTVGLAPAFAEAVAFISGINLAFLGQPLGGFEEWLVVRKHYPQAQLWQSIILNSINAKFAFGKPGWSLNPEDDVAATKVLTDVLTEFFDEMNASHDSLRNVYVEHQVWLWCQEWYAPDVPGYIPPPDATS